MNIRFVVYILLFIIFLTFVPGWVYFLPQEYVEKKAIEAIKEDFIYRTGRKFSYKIKKDYSIKRFGIMPILGDASWYGVYKYNENGKNFSATVLISGNFCIQIITNDLSDFYRVIMPSKPHENCFR